jgi:hypothetical protein
VIKAALGLIVVEPLKPPYPALDFETPANSLHEAQASRQMTISTRGQSLLARRTVSASHSRNASAASFQWLHSTRNLDFCLLALCSCLLAVLCHQVVVIPGNSAAAGSIASSAATTRSAQLDFLLKAGLFTGKGQPEIGEDPV